MEKKMPEKKFSTGAISATIWKNSGKRKESGEDIEFRSVNLQRRYTDKEGNWKSTDSFRINDLPKAVVVMQKAFEYVILKETSEVKEESSPSSPSSDEEDEKIADEGYRSEMREEISAQEMLLRTK